MLVNAHRSVLDACLVKYASVNELPVEQCHDNITKPMAFTGRIKAMVDECKKRNFD